MSPRAPCEARDAIPGRNAQSGQRVRQARDAHGEIAIRIARKAAALLTPDDLAISVRARRLIQNPPDRKREIHHCPRDHPPLLSFVQVQVAAVLGFIEHVSRFGQNRR
jgi:hypothetical protein